MAGQKKTKKKKTHYEYERRFAPDEFDLLSVLRVARSLGAVGLPQRSLLVNAAFGLPGKPDLHVRLRGDISARKGGGRTLLTVKRTGGEFEEERETYVADAGQAQQLLEMMGCVLQYTSEKFRDVLVVPGMGELDIDTYPGLQPCLEVECPSAAKLGRLVRLLGLPSKTASDGSKGKLGSMYRDAYGVPVEGRDTSGDLTFASPSNILQHITRNTAQFRRLLAQQRAAAGELRQSASSHI